MFLSRGYQSSVSNSLHFGLGTSSKIDSISILWPDNKHQKITNLEVNKTVIIKYKNASQTSNLNFKPEALFENIEPSLLGINYTQKENNFNDFDLQLLLPQKQSEKSSPLVVGDINNDGLDDFFVGNAKNAAAALYIQKTNGTFIETNQDLFNSDSVFEDTDAQFVDIDNDNDLDLYVASGGYEIQENSKLLQNRLYLNNGKGRFKKPSYLKV